MNIVSSFLSRNWQRLSLERFGEPSSLSYVITTPRFRSSSHIIFLVLARGSSEPVLVVKVPRLPGDDGGLNREANNLRLIHRARSGGFDSIPRLVTYEDYFNNRMLIETALTGTTLSSRLKAKLPSDSIESVVSWLIGLHQSTTERSSDVAGWHRRLVQNPLDQFVKAMLLTDEELLMIERTRALTSSLRGQDIPLVFEHKDLGPPNILLGKRGEVGVVDWELAEPSGLPVVDLYFFLALVMFGRRRARSQADYVAAFHEAFFGPSAWARSHIVRYADSLQLSPELLTPLFVLCWSRYVAGLVTRLHDDGTGALLPNATAKWLRSNRYYALWRHTLSEMDKLNLGY